MQYANFFDVSTDFLLGLTDERRTYAPTDQIGYLYTSLSDILTNLTVEQQNEITRNLMRYARSRVCIACTTTWSDFATLLSVGPATGIFCICIPHGFFPPSQFESTIILAHMFYICKFTILEFCGILHFNFKFKYNNMHIK